MLKKTSFFVIGTAFVVLLIANLFITYIDEEEQTDIPQVRDETTYRHIRQGDIVGFIDQHGRSEERRVGKECRSRWSPYH